MAKKKNLKRRPPARKLRNCLRPEAEECLKKEKENVREYAILSARMDLLWMKSHWFHWNYVVSVNFVALLVAILTPLGDKKNILKVKNLKR